MYAEADTSSSASIVFEDVFQIINSFGRYQKVMYFGSCFLVLQMASNFGLLVFAFAAPSFHCNTANITCAKSTCCDNCTSYSFDRAFTSTVTEWNLICGRAGLNAVIQTCFYVGMLFGAITSGVVSDTFGRKKCIFIFNGLMTVSGFASSFSNSVPLMAFFWFVMGFGIIGLFLSHYIYIMEIVGPKYRTMAGNFNWLYWGAGSFLVVLMAYFIRNWRTLVMLSASPCVLLFFFWSVFPESPRWLVAHDHLEEANAVLLKYGGTQNKPIDKESLKKRIAEIRRVQIENQRKAPDPRMLCRTTKIRKWSVALAFNWFSLAFVSNALFLYITNLSGNIYLNFTIIQVVGTVLKPIIWLVLKMFGRRIPHAIVMFLVGITCLLVLAVPERYPSVKSGLFLAASGITYSLWTTVYMITSEIYPTVVRNTAQGAGSTIGRCSAMLAPFVAMLGRMPGFGHTVPVVIFGVLCLSAGAISLLIPETLFAPMHQTIEEAEAATDDYGIPCCGKPGKKWSMRNDEAELQHLST